MEAVYKRGCSRGEGDSKEDDAVSKALQRWFLYEHDCKLGPLVVDPATTGFDARVAEARRSLYLRGRVTHLPYLYALAHIITKSHNGYECAVRGRELACGRGWDGGMGFRCASPTDRPSAIPCRGLLCLLGSNKDGAYGYYPWRKGQVHASYSGAGAGVGAGAGAGAGSGASPPAGGDTGPAPSSESLPRDDEDIFTRSGTAPDGVVTDSESDDADSDAEGESKGRRGRGRRHGGHRKKGHKHGSGKSDEGDAVDLDEADGTPRLATTPLPSRLPLSPCCCTMVGPSPARLDSSRRRCTRPTQTRCHGRPRLWARHLAGALRLWCGSRRSVAGGEAGAPASSAAATRRVLPPPRPAPIAHTARTVATRPPVRCVHGMG